MTTIAVIGAGIVGLATCHALRQRGLSVCLYDPESPGQGTSFGNAGLIANYATAPMASLDTLSHLPRELRRADPSIGIDPRYVPALAGFGWRFLRAATPSRFARHKANLVALIDAAVCAQHELLDSLGDTSLFADTGCLQVMRDTPKAASMLHAMEAGKRADGVECEALGPAEVHDLEPELNRAGLSGGLYFPTTRHLRDSLSVSRRLFERLEGPGFRYVAARVDALEAISEGGWRISAAGETRENDRVVLCAGIANNPLLGDLGWRLPVVSERGYHVTLKTPLSLARPVGWLAHHFYATPMQAGVRLAGTTEFSAPGKAADERRWAYLKEWGETLFGRPVALENGWMGVRHSTPDGLPVIGELPGHPGLIVAYGHGHLGLTLSAETGQLVAGVAAGDPLPDYARSLSPERFLRGGR